MRELGNVESTKGRPVTAENSGRARRRVLVVAPHFVPSNLASVHRSRLFALHLREFGWEPIIVTVDHRWYEEKLDWNLAKLVPSDLRVERVRALPTRPIRLVGDIGVRGFVPMLRRILALIDREQIDFLYVTIPSFFAAPLGRMAHDRRGVPYGIDYIDPWVHVFPGSERLFTKAWLSRKLAEWLEPYAVAKATLITGVAEGYYKGVFDRNPRLQGRVVTAAMPYGGEERDHQQARSLRLEPYLFQREPGTFRLLYAGALLPKAVEPLDRVFQSISANRDVFRNTVFHFVGTGRSPDDNQGYQVRPIAEKYGLWGSVVEEHPARIPYLDVLTHLEHADAAFIQGSTEPHYTPSKVYQAVLSGKPILAVLHRASTACDVIRETGAGMVLAIEGAAGMNAITDEFPDMFRRFVEFAKAFDPSQVNRRVFEAFSARSTALQLAEALDRALGRGAVTSDIAALVSTE